MKESDSCGYIYIDQKICYGQIEIFWAHMWGEVLELYGCVIKFTISW